MRLSLNRCHHLFLGELQKAILTGIVTLLRSFSIASRQIYYTLDTTQEGGYSWDLVRSGDCKNHLSAFNRRFASYVTSGFTYYIADIYDTTALNNNEIDKYIGEHSYNDS